MLRVEPCTRAAAKYAVEHWHYSETLPAGKLVSFGVWEERFIGAVVFGRGANNNLGKPYGLPQTQCCELVRVALTEHAAPVSAIVSRALRGLQKTSPGLRLVVSFADPAEGHHGGIYQAGNWLYKGRSQDQRELVVGGKFMHKRTASSRFGTVSPEAISTIYGVPAHWGPVQWKHTYLYPLDKAMRRKLNPLALPYPSAEEVSTVRHQPAGLEGQVRSLHSAPLDT